ncbi:C40 family peptidase [Pseudomonas rustica]|uniref:C40 family peptidase n=1 Tax=Pseudomonas rustica TaxID=2827099 RepID=A0ABS5MTU1_9PSED|nr:C40 family peptidase [Pseudomonas rustica]MBS4077711.1 C40 family peptidase [Pseudomonas rustica]
MRRYILSFYLSLALMGGSPMALGEKRDRISVPVGLSTISINAELSPTNRIVDRAHELIGTRYRWGGSNVREGFDCSGLLVYLFKTEAGIQLPRTTASMFNSLGQVVPRKQLKPGDAVFFKHDRRRPVSHVGVYIGGGRFIHAPSRGKVMRIDLLESDYWNKRYLAAKRFHEFSANEFY